jgi:hypothetical protein
LKKPSRISIRISVKDPRRMYTYTYLQTDPTPNPASSYLQVTGIKENLKLACSLIFEILINPD